MSAKPNKAPITIASAISTHLTTTTSPISGSSPIRPAKKKVTELKCSEVRWFYEKSGDSKWTPFRGHDSLTLELTYRAINNIPLDFQAKEIASQFSISEKISLFDNLYEWDPKNDPETIKSIYWKDDSIKIRRGTWVFADTLQPLEPEFADEIEKHHLEKFRNQVIPDTPVFSEYDSTKKPILTVLKWGDHDEVRWNSVIDILFYNNSKANRFMRLVTRAKGVYPLKRGYTHEADIDDGRPEFSDLILVIHGIGQKGYENLIAKNTSQIREAVEALMQKNYPNEKRRPMVLPIEWRSALVLDGDLTDTITLPRMLGFRSTLNSVAMDIMYYQSPLYRQEIINGVGQCLNSTYSKFIQSHPKFTGPVSIFAHSLGSVIAYDIITNWSPLMLYDQFVTNSIEKRLDSANNEEQRKMYSNFSESRKALLENGHLKDIFLNQDEKLCFKVKFLFCVGSPLAVFVVMRGHAQSFIPEKSKCEQIVNIFHPYDPVAYRLEPLFHQNYKLIRPAKILTYSDSNRDYDKMSFELHKGYMKKMRKEAKKKAKQKADGSENLQKADEIDDDDDDDDDSENEYQSSNGGASPRSKSPLTPEQEKSDLPPTANTGGSGRWWRFGGSNTVSDIKKDEKEKEEEKKPEPDVKKSPLEQLLDEIPEDNKLPQRLDFHLQTSAATFSYLALMNAHFSYWTNMDLVALVLNMMYKTKDDNEEAAKNSVEGMLNRTHETTEQQETEQNEMEKQKEMEQKGPEKQIETEKQKEIETK